MRRGFTLIEAVAVVGIVCFLFAILSSAMRGGLSSARQMQCVANLRQLVGANYLYANDNGGFFAPASSRNNNTRWHGQRKSCNAPYDSRMGYLSPYFCQGEGITGTPNPPNYYTDDPLRGTGRELECKEFLSYSLNAGSFEKGAGCYGYNATYIGGSEGSMFRGTHMDTLTDPSRTIMFADTAFSWGGSGSIQEYPFAEPFRSVRADGSLGDGLIPSIHFRHNGKANIAWADGHVTCEEPSELYSDSLDVGWIGDRYNNGPWNSRQVRQQ